MPPGPRAGISPPLATERNPASDGLEISRDPGPNRSRGLVQETRVYQGSNRGALVNGLGRRVDRAGTKLAPPIKQGSRLALNLSAADARGRRTARFFVDGSEAATFALQDDGSNTGWVAGVTLSDRARVRLVPAEGAELAQRARAINEVMIF